MITLNDVELNVVSGGTSLPPVEGVKVKNLVPEDMYGCKMSYEDWMDWTAREHDPVNGDSIHDFPGGPGRN